MSELTPGQDSLNEKLSRQGADFEINSPDDAKIMIDSARKVLEDRIKNGGNFEDCLQRDPENDKDIEEKSNTRIYSIVLEINDKKVEIGQVVVNYDADEEGVKNAFLADVGIFVKSLREGLGLGNLLLKKVEVDARKLGCKSITAWSMNNRVDSGDHPCFFYKKLGYKIRSKYTEDQIREANTVGEIFGVGVIKDLNE